MIENSRYGIKFTLTVALPLLLATLGVVGLSQDLLDRVSAGANLADSERTREIVVSAFETAERQLANTVADYANWDDAVRHAYSEHPEEWFKQTLGKFTAGGINFDGALLVDAHANSLLAGYVRGARSNRDLHDYFSGQIEGLLQKFPDEGAWFEPVSAIVPTGDGLAMVAAAPIVPLVSASLDAPSGNPRYLVLMKFVSPQFMALIGKQYVIEGLKFHEANRGPAAGLKLVAANGVAAGTVSWKNRLPGDIAGLQVWRKAILVLSYLAFVVFCVALFCWKLIQRMAKREIDAINSALHDPLTGLPNRTALQDEIAGLARNFGQKFSIAFTDLDGFKEVNDTYDHDTGDRLIKAVSAALLHLIRDGGQIFRLGGDEFVALFPGKDSEARAQNFARSLIELLSLPINIDGKMAAVGASVGIVTADIGGMDVQEIMRRADIAMYEAKAAGKNRFCVFTPEFDAERHETLAIADELRRINAAGTIEVAYQPIIDARTRLITGVEALARWPSNSARRVAPERFVAVAETCGLIDDFGESILKRACMDAKAWPGLLLSVNISPVQLRNASFATRMNNIVAKAGIDPRSVEFEITEGTLVHDFARTKRVVAQLRATGFQIALDDFGAGFSSVGYLRQFDFDRLKIDRSLVEKVLMSSSDQTVLQGTMLLASALTSHVTAEGVEREEQIELLRLTGCTEFQGYFFSPPVPAAEITRMIGEQAAEAA